MVRRAQKERKALRRARSEAETSLTSRQGSYIPPDREKCKARQWVQAYDDASTVRVQFNLWSLDGRPVDFAIIVQRLGTDGWEDVERYDCCHGHCHLHADGKDSSASIYQLDTQDDVKVALTRAEAESADRARIIRDKER